MVVATGSAPLIPPIDGLREAEAVDEPRGHHRQGGARRGWRSSAAAWSGVEMAQACSTLGSQVTLIERGDRLIAREEPFACDEVEQSLREQGVDVLLGTERDRGARRGRRGDGRARRRAARCAPTSCSWRSGAQPNTDDIGLDTVGLEPGKPIEVDDSMRAKAPTGCTRSAT